MAKTNAAIIQKLNPPDALAVKVISAIEYPNRSEPRITLALKKKVRRQM